VVLQQLDATVRQHHADAQAKSQSGAVTGNRYPNMTAVVKLTTFCPFGGLYDVACTQRQEK